MNEDEYYSAVIDCMDHGGQMAAQEYQDAAERSEQELTDMLVADVEEGSTVATMPTRSGWRIRPPDQSSFVFYD